MLGTLVSLAQVWVGNAKFGSGVISGLRVFRISVRA